MRNLRIPNDPNTLELVVKDIEIKPYREGIYIKIFSYNLNDLLSQMLEDYSEEEIIKHIKAL